MKKEALEQKISHYQAQFHHTADFHTELLHIGETKAVLFWFTTMSDPDLIADKTNLIYNGLSAGSPSQTEAQDAGTLFRSILGGSGYMIIRTEEEIVRECMDGKAILLVEGIEGAAALEVTNRQYRSIEEPSTMTIIRGPKDGFIESSQVNMSLIRRRIRHKDLIFEQFILGSETMSTVYLAYVDGIIDPGILKEIRHRLNKAKPNAVFDTGVLEEYIVDTNFTPFPMTYSSERPDAIAAHLISGKAAIIVEGSPFVLSMPTVFSDFFQSSEDYYQPFMIATFVRIIRYIAFLIALLFPAIYTSAVTYHFELVPTELLFSIGSQREDLPFPVFVEALLMETTFEILREAGIRMPRAVGPTVSIVGGLVIGQAAVEAGIVSNTMVIIVALTAISSFVTPIYNLSIATRLLRFLLLFLGAFIGFYGIMLGMICIVGHMCSLRTLGVAYSAPFGPLLVREHMDTVVRFPAWSMKKRPRFLHPAKPNKQPNAQAPAIPAKEKEMGKEKQREEGKP